MLKVLKGLIFSISVLAIMLSLPNICYAGWPINICPGVEGQVLDATTGQPIGNAIIQVNYIKKQYAIVDVVDKLIAETLTITNKEGKYLITSKFSWHLLSGFYTAIITVRHPFYETQKTSIFKRYGVALEKKGYIGVINNGRIQYEFKLASLAERKSLPDSWEYFAWAKELGVPLNIEDIFDKWDELLIKSESSDKHHIEWLKGESKKAYQK